MRSKTHRELVKGWNPFTDEEIKRYVKNGLWRNLTTCDLLDRNAEIFPDKVAVIDDISQVTWRELRYMSNRMAIHLNKLGVEYGDFFVLQMPNTVELMCMFLGLNRLGAIPVMCIPRHRKIEINYELSLHEAKGIAVPSEEKFDHVGMVEEIRPDHPYLKLFLKVGGEAPPGWLSIEQLMKEEVEKEYPEDYLEQFKPEPNDICMQLLSGGTTGVPKAIPRTYNDFICGGEYVGRTLGFTDDSIALIMTPAGHGMALVCIIAPALITGYTIVLSRSTRVNNLCELIQKHRVTHSMPMPIQLAYFKEAEDTLKDYDLSSLKVLAIGAARPELVKWVMDELGVNFLNLFGMSEGPQLYQRWDSPRESQLYTIGKPIVIHPDNITRLVDDDNNEVKQGETGELASRGPATFKGYFRNEEENKKSFDEEGFFHTGDLMSIRQDGRYVFEGRKKYMIKRGGENIYPEAVETLVSNHPKVEVCAMIGMPDVGLNERLCAFVQPVKGETMTLDEIVTYLKEKGLAIFQCPERLEIVSGWPLSTSNKINIRLLKAHITAKLYQEGVIDKEYGNSYLKLEKINIDDVLSGKLQIEFTGAPS